MGWPLSAPEVLEPPWCQLGIANRVLDILVAEIGLERPGISALVGQRIAAGVAQLMRMHQEGQSGRDSGTFHKGSKAYDREGRTERYNTFANSGQRAAHWSFQLCAFLTGQ